MELVNLQAGQLGRAEQLESLKDLGAGGDEGGGVLSFLGFRLLFLGRSNKSC